MTGGEAFVGRPTGGVHDSRGQASIDYVGILAVVALILGAAATAVGAPWLAPRVASGIRHGICVVSGALCTPREAREAGLAPCPIRRRSDSEHVGVVALIRLQRGDALVVERRSDGRATVSFVDGAKAGVEAGVGVTLPGVAGSVNAGVGVRFAAGRTFEFGSWSKAQRFLARFAGEETLTGEARRALRRLCWRCPEWLEGGGRALPEPTARYIEGGSFDSFVAELGAVIPATGRRGPIRVGLDARGSRALVLGRRTAGPRVTWYLRLEADVLATLGVVMGSLEAGRRTEGVLEVIFEGGEPVEARVKGSAAITGKAEFAGQGVDLGEVADRLRAATVPATDDAEAKEGLAVEATVSLDLREEANLRAVEGLMHPGGSPLEWLERLRAVARRVDVAGAVDLSVLRFERKAADRTLEGGQLVRVGGGYGRVEETRDLVAAWSLRAGGPWRRREDCEAAAQAAA